MRVLSPTPGGVVDAARSVELIVGRRRDLPDRDCRLTHRSAQRVPGRRDGHLAEAHARVVRGDPGVGEHPEPGGLRARRRAGRSSSTFWNTPPESATVSRPVAAQASAAARASRPARPAWNRAAITGTSTPGAQVVDDPADEVRPVQQPALDPGRVAAGRPERGIRRTDAADAPRTQRRVVRRLLQLDRRLALVVDGVAHPDQRRHGVEQPPTLVVTGHARPASRAGARPSPSPGCAGRRRGRRRRCRPHAATPPPSATAGGSRSSRPAAAPPRRWARRRNPVSETSMTSPPHSAPSVP